MAVRNKRQTKLVGMLRSNIFGTFVRIRRLTFVNGQRFPVQELPR
jgi:hypothetical protein